MKLKLKRRKKKTKEIKHQQKKMIKATKIPAKQISKKQNISNYIRKL